MNDLHKKPPDHSLILIPIVGAITFCVLYIIAANLYPGGSPVDKYAKGFSWINNYWCNLLNEKAINGEQNLARPIALTAMPVMCFTLASFWFYFPRYIYLNKNLRLTIQLSGSIAMFVTLFLFTNFHDLIINIAGVFGLIALVGTFICLYKLKWFVLFGYGISNLLLVALNNYIYYTANLLIFTIHPKNQFCSIFNLDMLYLCLFVQTKNRLTL